MPKAKPKDKENPFAIGADQSNYGTPQSDLINLDTPKGDAPGPQLFDIATPSRHDQPDLEEAIEDCGQDLVMPCPCRQTCKLHLRFKELQEDMLRDRLRRKPPGSSYRLRNEPSASASTELINARPSPPPQPSKPAGSKDPLHLRLQVPESRFVMTGPPSDGESSSSNDADDEEKWLRR